MPIQVCTTVADAREALTGRSSAVVLVPVHDAYEDLVQCLEAILQHGLPDTDVLLVDDASTDARIAALPDQLRGVTQRIVLLRQGENQGFVRTANAGFRAAGRRDVVLLNSDVVIGPQCFERLREAAYSDSRIATATPLTNHGAIVSVPYRNTPSELPPGLTPALAATAVAGASHRRRPHLPTCVGHCTYVRRMALDLVGEFDEAFSPGYGEEVDFSQRCTLLGLAHVCADDVFVYHRGGGSFGQAPEVQRLRLRHEETLARRYPFYHPLVRAVASARGTPLALAVADARRALLGMTVAVDATCLGPVLAGTQRTVLETICALTRHPGVGKVVAVVPEEIGPEFTVALRSCPKLVTMPAAEVRGPVGDVVYRPFQISAVGELERLRVWGEKLVVAQLDMIAFSNPGYFARWRDWLRYRDATGLALAVADGVAFLSEHARAEARGMGLIAPGQPTEVINCGTEHGAPAPVPVRPEGLREDVVPGGFLLCLGADYQHKNRLFALRVFGGMVERGCKDHLVLAGLRIADGSSRALEAEYLLRRRDVAQRVVSLAHVPDGARAWLLSHARLVIHPTLYEGFGLVPFEAALAGTPCLTSAQGSLAELLPSDAEIITEWHAEAVADQTMALLADADRRARLVAALARRARDFTWDRTADRLVNLFQTVSRTLRGPRVAAVEGDQGIVALRRTPLDGNGADALYGVVQPMYPREFHEAMRAIGQRPGLRAPLVAVTVLGYRLFSALRSRVVRATGDDPTVEDGPTPD